MELDPHQTHIYTHEMLIKSAFELELQNKNYKKRLELDWEAVEAYLKDRVAEIKDRWK